MKCLIMSGGEKPKDEVIRKYASSCELIIGVDKGCNYLYDLNITPQYIVGDFDSSKAEVIKKLENLGAAKYKYNCEKDFTDSEEAFELAISKKASEIYFLGSTGKRLDHTLGNLGLLLNALNNGVRAQIIDDRNKVFLVNSNFKIYSDDEYKYISFLAYNEEIKEFTIKDAKYTLDKYKLKVGDSRTVSNEFNSNEINIEVSNGNLLVMFSKD